MPREAHECRWPGCRELVMPRMWGCKLHWERLPRSLRGRLLAAFGPEPGRASRVDLRWVEADAQARAFAEAYDRRQAEDRPQDGCTKSAHQ